MNSRFVFFASLILIVSSSLSNNVVINNLNTSGSKTGLTLSWDCSVGENDYLFVIQRSADAVVFSTLDTLRSTPFVEEYGFLDSAPLIGISYYKIICYKPGSDEISSAITYAEVSEEESINSFQISGIYPIPFADNFNIVIESKNDVVLTIQANDLDGSLLFETTEAFNKGRTVFNISDFTSLKSDSYILTVTDEHLFKETARLIRYDDQR